MTFRDFIELSIGNLWRMKLRAFLTISGVLIAIAAFVAMLSFGAGLQKTVSAEFDDFGLLNTIHVYPPDAEDVPDSVTAPVLDSAAVERLAALPGVNLAYPFDRFSVTIDCGDTAINSYAQALSTKAMQTKLYSQFMAGRGFDDDHSKDAIVTSRLLRELDMDTAEALIGDTIIVSVNVVSLDSALASLIYHGNIDSLKQKLRSVEIDSLRDRGYRRSLVNREIGGGLERFLDGFVNARATVSDTLIVAGVIRRGGSRRAGTQPLITTVETGHRLAQAGFSGGPQDLFSAIASGEISGIFTGSISRTYRSVTLDIDPNMAYNPIRDSVKALGYKTFSYGEEFEQMRRVFLYFDLALGMVGIIALVTSSLGIVNTMLMSIMERRREIGIIKSLGADEREIRFLFLAESGLIGFIGALSGLLLGWLISRLGSFIAQSYMKKEGFPPIDIFDVPLWLIGAALSIGVLVSLIAGYYPSSRAARVDAVTALRNE